MQARVMREIWGGEPYRALKKFTNNSKLLTEIKELPAVGKIPGKRINRLFLQAQRNGFAKILFSFFEAKHGS